MAMVEMLGITKRFGHVLANDGVDFHLRSGEIHALLGENGAGKTTLMRILYGLYRADTGTIRFDGRPVHISSPKHAIDLGIGMVTQHFTLVAPLSVAENIALGRTGGFRLNMAALRKQVAASAARFHLDIDPTALVRYLSVGQKQRVEIAKALYRNARVLILDEPTAVLTPQEATGLFQTLVELRNSGISCIFITHKLEEVMAVTERVTVLRDGRVVGTGETAHTTQRELAQLMVGRETASVCRPETAVGAQLVLDVQQLSARDDQGLPALDQVSLTVHAGEILGLAGVSGNGQKELAEVLCGVRRPTAGRFLVGGRDVTGAAPGAIDAAGVGRVPEDRHSGVVGELSVAENLALEHLSEFTRGGVLNLAAMRQHAEALIAQYQIKARPTDRARTLSGGNLQKVIMARALARQPKLIIAAQPTRGLDVGATEYVRQQLLAQRARGAGVLMISEDLEEILSLSDRIAVLFEGKIVGVVPTCNADVASLGLMMCGGGKEGTCG